MSKISKSKIEMENLIHSVSDNPSSAILEMETRINELKIIQHVIKYLENLIAHVQGVQGMYIDDGTQSC